MRAFMSDFLPDSGHYYNGWWSVSGIMPSVIKCYCCGKSSTEGGKFVVFGCSAWRVCRECVAAIVH